jgi:uncharacterized membrane protein
MNNFPRDPFSKDTSNPFAAPRARVDDSGSGPAGPLRNEPRGVEFGRGFGWFGDGWALVREATGTWIGLTVVYLLVSMAINLIPILNALSPLLHPVLTAGLMLGCHSLAAGRGLEISHLFAGFQHRFGGLVLVGFLTLVAGVVIVLVPLLGILGPSALMQAAAENADELPNLALVLLAALVVLALMVPLMMAVWFAPALVALNDLPALQAMKLSFKGCLRNLMPFLAYGLLGLVFAVLATIPVGLGWLVLLPVLFASTYTAYRDIFVD